MFRILTLDGGCIKGTSSAAVLAEIEKEAKAPIGEYFDLIAGTSTGGILALGLGFRIPAAEILKFYQGMGPKIFPAMGPLGTRGLIRQFFTTRYSSATLRDALSNVLGNHKLGESTNRLIIPAYDAIGGRIFALKTAHHEQFKYDVNPLAADVALATSAAPTYFDASPLPAHPSSSFVDGGVWPNNPVLSAIVEATCFLNVPLNDIDVLSIGTTFTPFSIAEKGRSGFIGWNRDIITLMFEAQAETALAQARLLLTGRVLRLNVVTKPGQFSLGDASPEKIAWLTNLGRSEAVKKVNLEALKNRFICEPRASPFFPVHPVQAAA